MASPDGKTGKPQAYWVWVKYGVDFVKEDGKWKIRHFKVYATFETPYDKGWVKWPHPSIMQPKASADTPKFKDYPPDKPTVYHRPYDPKAETGTEPLPPEPYETY